MIIVLKREDLPQEHRQQTMEALELDHGNLPTELIERAELIVFVEGTKVKFLKHFPEMQSKDSLEVFLRYIMSLPPVTKERTPYSRKRVAAYWKKKK